MAATPPSLGNSKKCLALYFAVFRVVQHPGPSQDVDRADVLVVGQRLFGRLNNSLTQLLTIGVQISDSFRGYFALMYQHGRR